MNIVFRVDASIQIGGGHFMRCLTLADELSIKGCEITFISRDLPGNLFSLLENKAYRVCKLPVLSNDEALYWQEDAEETSSYIEASGKQADWVIVDHYELDKRWESSLREYTKKIMVIDDLANRSHNCHLLLDQNYYCDQYTRYDDLLNSDCLKLIGPKYVLLRPEYKYAREKLRERDGKIKRILIFFGSSDPLNLTTKAIDAIQLLGRDDIDVDVVVGSSNPQQAKIKDRCQHISNMTYLCQVDNMAELMARADLALGAGGASMWERCFLGLPSITVVFASNQEQTTIDVATTDAIIYLGWTSQLEAQDYTDAMNRMILNPDEVRAISDNAISLLGNMVSVAEVLLNVDIDIKTYSQ